MRAALAALLVSLASSAFAQDGGVVDAGALQLISFGDSWRYRVGDSAPPLDWAQPTYDDELWKSGVTPLGYGESRVPAPFSGTPTSFAARTRFDLRVDPSLLTSLVARVDFDDGLALYLNGHEVVRRNLSGGAAWNAAATGGHNAGNVATIDLAASRGYLVRGENVVAAEVHNEGGTSTDAIFDLELTTSTDEVPPPVLVDLSPGLGSTNAPRDTALTFVLLDYTGVDEPALVLSVNGQQVVPELEGNAFARTVRYQPSSPFVAGQMVSVEVQATNRAGVAMEPFVWTFKISAPGQGLLDAGGCACRHSGTGGGVWLLALGFVAWAASRRRGRQEA